MNIQLPNDHAITTDGRQFTLRPEGVQFAGFNDLAFGLVKRGIIAKAQQQTGEMSRRYAEIAADTMIETWVLSHTSALERNVFVLFGDAKFIALPGKRGAWVLLNPEKTVKTLQDDWHGHGDIIVGYVPSLRAAFDLAVRRAFHAQDLTIPYEELNQHLETLAGSILLNAYAMTGDPFTGFEMLPWKKPPAEWTKNFPDLPESSEDAAQSA